MSSKRKPYSWSLPSLKPGLFRFGNSGTWSSSKQIQPQTQQQQTQPASSAVPPTRPQVHRTAAGQYGQAPHTAVPYPYSYTHGSGLETPPPRSLPRLPPIRPPRDSDVYLPGFPPTPPHAGHEYRPPHPSVAAGGLLPPPRPRPPQDNTWHQPQQRHERDLERSFDAIQRQQSSDFRLKEVPKRRQRKKENVEETCDDISMPPRAYEAGPAAGGVSGPGHFTASTQKMTSPYDQQPIPAIRKREKKRKKRLDGDGAIEFGAVQPVSEKGGKKHLVESRDDISTGSGLVASMPGYPESVDEAAVAPLSLRRKRNGPDQGRAAESSLQPHQQQHSGHETDRTAAVSQTLQGLEPSYYAPKEESYSANQKKKKRGGRRDRLASQDMPTTNNDVHHQESLRLNGSASEPGKEGPGGKSRNERDGNRDSEQEQWDQYRTRLDMFFARLEEPDPDENPAMLVPPSPEPMDPEPPVGIRTALARKVSVSSPRLVHVRRQKGKGLPPPERPSPDRALPPVPNKREKKHMNKRLMVNLEALAKLSGTDGTDAKEPSLACPMAETNEQEQMPPPESTVNPGQERDPLLTPAPLSLASRLKPNNSLKVTIPPPPPERNETSGNDNNDESYSPTSVYAQTPRGTQTFTPTYLRASIYPRGGAANPRGTLLVNTCRLCRQPVAAGLQGNGLCEECQGDYSRSISMYGVDAGGHDDGQEVRVGRASSVSIAVELDSPAGRKLSSSSGGSVGRAVGHKALLEQIGLDLVIKEQGEGAEEEESLEPAQQKTEQVDEPGGGTHDTDDADDPYGWADYYFS